MIRNDLIRYRSRVGIVNKKGLTEGCPFLVLFVLLLFMRRVNTVPDP